MPEERDYTSNAEEAWSPLISLFWDIKSSHIRQVSVNHIVLVLLMREMYCRTNKQQQTAIANDLILACVVDLSPYIIPDGAI